MQIITPVTITDAKLVSSSLPETDHAAWAAGTNYAAGARVVYAPTHSVYQRVAAGISPGTPDTDVANWLRVGPTNRWAMFDRATGSISTSPGNMTFTLSPGLVRGIALLDVTANSVTVTMSHDGLEVYRREVSLNTGYGVNDWYTYFFSEVVLKRTLVLTDLPPYGEAEITVTLAGTGATSVGTAIVGSVFELGGTRSGMQFGMLDYSVKSTDNFGVTTLVERAYAKRMTVPIAIRTPNVDEVGRRLTQIRATPVVWIGTSRFDQSIVYGFAKDWSIDLAYDQVSFCSLTIEGLS